MKETKSPAPSKSRVGAQTHAGTDKEGKVLRVLIVEDVATDAELVRAELRRASLQFTSRCVDAKEPYLRALKEFTPDIVLSDFSMPGFDALEALELLKKISDSIPFILVTGSQSEEVAVRCMREGADDYILKTTLKRLPAAMLNAIKKKQAEESIEKLAAFPRLNPNPIFELTAQGKLDYCNEAASALARLAGKKPEDILPDNIAALVNECLRTGNSKLRRETGIANRFFAWCFFPITPRQMVHCYAFDITERLNLEAQLRQSQKMESIGQLAAGIAHDFNNILTIIKGYSSMLLERPLEPEIHDPIQQIAAASERATNLTRQLLLFSRKQVMETQVIDLNEVISDVTKFLRRILGEDITLHFNYSPNLPLIQADSGMIEQIIMNLAVNARDALPRGGTLTIGTHATAINETHVRLNPEAKVGQYVCLRVSDNGTGMEEPILSHIFEPFFTTKEVGKGTGLGLATVYGIVQQHQGWIEVLTEKGKGTTFRVFLPATPRSVEAKTPDSSGDSFSFGNETVLVVEDEPVLRSIVCSILRQHGYTVLEAGSGPEAMDVWQAQSGKVDILFTDMVMPGNMNGKELSDKLKAKKPGLKVVYTSGYSVETMSKSFPYKRGLNFLQKPYHPSALVKIIRACLDY